MNRPLLARSDNPDAVQLRGRVSLIERRREPFNRIAGLDPAAKQFMSYGFRSAGAGMLGVAPVEEKDAQGGQRRGNASVAGEAPNVGGSAGLTDDVRACIASSSRRRLA